MSARISVLLLLALAACSKFPAVDAVVSAESLRAPYPTLLQVDDLPASSPPPPADPAAGLSAQAAILKKKAAGLSSLE